MWQPGWQTNSAESCGRQNEKEGKKEEKEKEKQALCHPAVETTACKQIEHFLNFMYNSSLHPNR